MQHIVFIVSDNPTDTQTSTDARFRLTNHLGHTLCTGYCKVKSPGVDAAAVINQCEIVPHLDEHHCNELPIHLSFPFILQPVILSFYRVETFHTRIFHPTSSINQLFFRRHFCLPYHCSFSYPDIDTCF